MNKVVCSLFLGATLLTSASLAHACPEIKHLVDFDCDQKMKIVAVGDSIVRGRGDLVNNNDGGWVKRIGKLLRTSAPQNLGVPGITTSRLYSTLKRDLAKPRSTTARKMADADIVIVSVGINDYFENSDPGLTVRNIKRIVKLIRNKLGELGKVAPFVTVAKLTPTTRTYQQSFTIDVDRLLARYRSTALPSYLRFDLLDPTLISFDGIHPVAAGYDELATIVAKFLKGDGRNLMLSERPDLDNDGIYDRFERGKFLTDPHEKDTDGDGLSDGKEVFTYHTDPNNPDTDGDGTNDGDEVAQHRNPLIPD